MRAALRTQVVRASRAFRLSLYRNFSLGTRPRPRVFGIGLSRTGTKSLHRALSLLGYRSDHFSTHLLRMRDEVPRLDMSEVSLFDALTDVTAAACFRELDAAFPGSKFVLTVRNEDAWLGSCGRHFPPLKPGTWPHGNAKVLALRRHLYGLESFDAPAFHSAFVQHREAVLSHFASRPGSLLVLDICAGQGWPELCGFLERPVPTQPFPWANRRGS